MGVGNSRNSGGLFLREEHLCLFTYKKKWGCGCGEESVWVQGEMAFGEIHKNGLMKTLKGFKILPNTFPNF